ncbi:hypothetical protein NDU88_002567 [Pleurodeles waltl]|uniref:Uncharacterized protein n=1 Tax=Pleurodeles waltl TaxID=8319 RepID=A0AAV7UA58_PLEWA|nr:hypothetical protein NDU88_002567 [Pleurodeles waltl]
MEACRVGAATARACSRYWPATDRSAAGKRPGVRWPPLSEGLPLPGDPTLKHWAAREEKRSKAGHGECVSSWREMLAQLNGLLRCLDDRCTNLRASGGDPGVANGRVW